MPASGTGGSSRVTPTAALALPARGRVCRVMGRTVCRSRSSAGACGARDGRLCRCQAPGCQPAGPVCPHPSRRDPCCRVRWVCTRVFLICIRASPPAVCPLCCRESLAACAIAERVARAQAILWPLASLRVRRGRTYQRRPAPCGLGAGACRGPRGDPSSRVAGRWVKGRRLQSLLRSTLVAAGGGALFLGANQPLFSYYLFM